MEVIDKKVLIKEARSAMTDLVALVKNLPKDLLFDEKGELLSGIRKSQTGDNGFVFERYDREGSERLDTIDRYIEGVWPRTTRIPKRIPNQAVEGLSSSPALTGPELERRFEDRYNVNCIDLPIPSAKESPRLEKTTAESQIARTYNQNDYYNPNNKDGIKKEKIKGPINLKCVGCGYEGKNEQALRMHIFHKHNIKKNKEAAVSSG